jgi:hypothetical protein
VPIADARLRGCAWLIVEDPGIAAVRDPWLRVRVSMPAIVNVADRVELFDVVGVARVYRVIVERAAPPSGAVSTAP